jgi:hypothetical protein
MKVETLVITTRENYCIVSVPESFFLTQSFILNYSICTYIYGPTNEPKYVVGIII